jgi:hypothetical protein
VYHVVFVSFWRHKLNDIRSLVAAIQPWLLKLKTCFCSTASHFHSRQDRSAFIWTFCTLQMSRLLCSLWCKILMVCSIGVQNSHKEGFIRLYYWHWHITWHQKSAIIQRFKVEITLATSLIVHLHVTKGKRPRFVRMYQRENCNKEAIRTVTWPN